MRMPLLLALAAAIAKGDNIPVSVESWSPKPSPPPLPSADPDEVDRLVREGAEHEIMACLHTRRVSRVQHTDLLRRLHDLDMQRAEARREETARREAVAKAQRQEAREAARAAAWSANPLSVRCPKCNAGKGKRCQGANATMPQPHTERVRALEGGCAFRVLQSATRLRERGHDAADEAYRIARELAPYELLPSPTWEVMCSEMEWPV